MKKIMQVKQPILNTYTLYGALFSILPDNALPWAMNNFIQLNFVFAWDMATFDYHRVLVRDCSFIEYYEDKEIIFDNKENRMKSAITESIDRDEYLFIYVDRFYLKMADEYHS